MGWNELSDPDMRTANFEFSYDVYREGVYTKCKSKIVLIFIAFEQVYKDCITVKEKIITMKKHFQYLDLILK